MTINIAVIGSGNVGSRHVQGLANSIAKMNVFVVDPKKNNLEKTKKLILENNLNNNKNINITFNQTISKINDSIDLAIISTNSDVRRQVIEKLVSLNDVKNIILEKIAFQKINDFDFIIKLLNEKKIKSFINFPRRVFKSYHNLKKEISKEKKIYFSVVGRNWGLASNTLHMLDLFSYLTTLLILKPQKNIIIVVLKNIKMETIMVLLLTILNPLNLTLILLMLISIEVLQKKYLRI